MILPTGIPRTATSLPSYRPEALSNWAVTEIVSWWEPRYHHPTPTAATTEITRATTMTSLPLIMLTYSP